ncbi:unnamed protein product [Adineta steineri]|nr:unnamed protein product [Adineta steineri]
MIAKRLGQWATRLYIVLFLVGLAILAVFTIVKPEPLTKTFDEPSIDEYNQLFQRYGDKLKCSCSSITSTYNQFANIEATFHEICSSPFATEEGRIYLTADLVSDLSDYTIKDYRRFLSAHLQFLLGLCQLSIQTVNISIQQFHSSLLTTVELLSEIKFKDHLEVIVKQHRRNAPTTFTSLLFLIRTVNHGNALMSTYGTNFEYVTLWNQLQDVYMPTQAMLYNDTCSCGLHHNCTIPAQFIITDPPKIVFIKGLKMGCTPSESFRASTLECFYDQSCIDLIQQYTINPNRINSTNFFNPLSTINNSRFSINTTIAEFIDELFVEEWKKSINYSSYFQQCSPLLCSYTYIQRFNVLHTVTILIGLQGGLTLVLKWICPKIIRIIFKIHQYRKKRINTVQPIYHIETIPMENTSTNIDNPATNATFDAIRVREWGIDSKACSLKFQQVSTTRGPSEFALHTHVVADFNGDKRLDVAFVDSKLNALKVLLGNGDGNFKRDILSVQHYLIDVTKLIVGDFSNDNIPDIAATIMMDASVTILLGNGDGSFINKVKLRMGHLHNPRDIALTDFDGDGYLDMAVAWIYNGSIGVFLGKGDGLFSEARTFHTGDGSYPSLIAIDDFNCDSYKDIIVANLYSSNIGIFFGYGNGFFEAQKTLVTVDFGNPIYFAVKDFNNDTLPDIVFCYQGRNLINVIFGDCDGTVGNIKAFSIGDAHMSHPFVISDFNGDCHLDIGFGKIGKRMDLFVGDGNGNFEVQTAFSSRFNTQFTWIGIGDFNGDGHEDIIEVDDNSLSQDVFLNTCK